MTSAYFTPREITERQVAGRIQSKSLWHATGRHRLAMHVFKPPMHDSILLHDCLLPKSSAIIRRSWGTFRLGRACPDQCHRGCILRPSEQWLGPARQQVRSSGGCSLLAAAAAWHAPPLTMPQRPVLLEVSSSTCTSTSRTCLSTSNRCGHSLCSPWRCCAGCRVAR